MNVTHYFQPQCQGKTKRKKGENEETDRSFVSNKCSRPQRFVSPKGEKHQTLRTVSLRRMHENTRQRGGYIPFQKGLKRRIDNS